MKTLKEIKNRIDEAENPLILFDDDPDGTCSFTLIYKYLGKGHGVIVKSSPEVKAEQYLHKIREYDPDLIIILDKPKVEDEFIEEAGCDIVWLDHHEIQDKPYKNLYYYNPSEKETTSTSGICWDLIGEERTQDVWIAFTGCVGDWHYSEKIKKIFLENYSDLIDPKLETAPELLFKTKIGKLVKIIAFNLKGKLGDVKKSFKILTRIESPEEILYGTTPAGKFLKDRFDKINKHYEQIKKTAMSAASDDLFLISVAPQPVFSFSSELSNEVLFNYPNKIIIVGRFNSGSAKCSIRTALDIDLRPIVKNAAEGIGHGGGHPQACGCCIDEEYFNDFLDKLKSGVKEALD